VGESLFERENNQTTEVLENQVRRALQFLRGEALSAQILFAYEPVWAIGEKGIPATSGYANLQHALIKDVANEILPTAPKVLYGGSVNPTNSTELTAQPHIDGLFIGRSAWEAENYIAILQLATNRE
jgi:triosephosphate isomerase